MQIEITIDTDGARTTVMHEFGLEVHNVQQADGQVAARFETPDLNTVATSVARHAADVHRLTL
jgi:hypothetical protein